MIAIGIAHNVCTDNLALNFCYDYHYHIARPDRSSHWQMSFCLQRA